MNFSSIFSVSVEEGQQNKIAFTLFYLYLEFNAYLLKERMICENVAMKKHIQVEIFRCSWQVTHVMGVY